MARSTATPPGRDASLFFIVLFLSGLPSRNHVILLLYHQSSRACQEDHRYLQWITSSWSLVLQLVVITVCLKAGMELDTWNWVCGKTVIVFAFNAFPVKEDFNLRVFLFSWQLCHVAIWGSIASWFIFLLIYCIPDIALYIAPDMIGQVCLFSLPTWVHCMGHHWPISNNIIKWFYK